MAGWKMTEDWMRRFKAIMGESGTDISWLEMHMLESGCTINIDVTVTRPGRVERIDGKVVGNGR